MFAMNALTVISTDLLTPLGAYLRLRQGGSASFLLESVEKGRLGRHSFVGCGSRLVSFDEAEACGQPVVGYLGYEHAASPRADRAGAGRGPRPAREPLRRRRHARPLRPRPRDGRGALRRPSRGRGAARGAAAFGRTGLAHAVGLDPPAAFAPPVRARGRQGEGAHPRRRRLPGRALAAGRAADLGQRARALPLAAPGQPVALSVPARARRPGAGRLLARDAGQGRGPPRVAEPDRGDDAARRRRRRAAALVREGPRRARDARRPRPQRPLARLPAGHGARGALPRAGALLARDAPRLRGRRRARAGGLALRPAARVLPGRDGLGRAEGAGDAADRRARALPPRAVRRRGALRAPGRGARRVHRDPHGRPARRASRCCRPAPGSSPTPTRPPSTTSACASWPRSRWRSSWRRRER